ncbi:MAG: ATP-grasp domain-containing protein [Eubacteriales bacterium]|nr:ATP-grasp domain-containing protein [Eubacteriales bacterium]
MKTVLLTAVGSASTAAVHRSLKAAGYRVIGCDIYPKTWTVNAGEMDAFFTVPLASETDKYLAALTKIVRSEKIDFVIPSTDVEVDVLCGHKEDFRALGATVCCPDRNVAELCRDKLRMAEALGTAGVCSVIPTYTAQTLPADLPYPLLLKPTHGRSSQGITVVGDPSELAFTLRSRTDAIIQPRLAGDIYTVDCARDTQGNVVTLVRRERLRAINGLGIAVDICPVHSLNAACRNIMDFVGIVGVVNMEFIHNGVAYSFLEVNPRFSGGVGFSVLAGYDFPLAMLACHEGEALATPPTFRPMTIAQRYEMRITEER